MNLSHLAFEGRILGVCQQDGKAHVFIEGVSEEAEVVPIKCSGEALKGGDAVTFVLARHIEPEIKEEAKAANG